MSLRPQRLWRFRIQDILDAIERVQQYTQDMDLERFRQDRRTLDAVERNFILIGEAAGGVPEEVTRDFLSLPWRTMRDMRNLVVHQYWGVDAERVWNTIQIDLPPLVPSLQRVLAETNEE